MTNAPKAFSKVAGGIKGTATALAGYPGIFTHLAGEHGEVAAMMSQVLGTFDDSAARKDLFAEIRTNLLAHAEGEEAAFYPRLRSFPELESLVAQCEQEHDEVKNYLKRLDDMDQSAEGWLDLFRQMKDAVETHVAREENELFPQARKLLDLEQAREMEEHYKEVEDSEQSRS